MTKKLHDEAIKFAEEFEPSASVRQKLLTASYYEIEALKSQITKLERQLGKFRSDDILMGAVLIESVLDVLPEGSLQDWQQDLAGAIPAMIYQLAGQIDVGYAAEKLRYRFRHGEWPEQTIVKENGTAPYLAFFLKKWRQYGKLYD